MRIAIAIAVVLLSLSHANAASGNTYLCSVVNFSMLTTSGRQDADFVAENWRRTYKIGVIDNSITVAANNGHTTDYNIVKETSFSVLGLTLLGSSLHSIAMEKEPGGKHGDKLAVSLSSQDIAETNTWMLLCSKS